AARGGVGLVAHADLAGTALVGGVAAEEEELVAREDAGVAEGRRLVAEAAAVGARGEAVGARLARGVAEDLAGVAAGAGDLILPAEDPGRRGAVAPLAVVAGDR